MLLLVFAIAVIFWVHELAVPLIFCTFAFFAPLKWLWTESISGRLFRGEPKVEG